MLKDISNYMSKIRQYILYYLISTNTIWCKYTKTWRRAQHASANDLLQLLDFDEKSKR